jgi:hypothetical protein
MRASRTRVGKFRSKTGKRVTPDTGGLGAWSSQGTEDIVQKTLFNTRLDIWGSSNRAQITREVVEMLFSWQKNLQLVMVLAAAFVSVSCVSTGSAPTDKNGGSTVSAQPTPTSKAGAVKLPAPVLSFNDTGLSVSDGITRNGLWDVDSAEIAWEFSFDLGQTWTRGQGNTFEVKDDGAKMIWVRARDDAGNTSEIVSVGCVLDTQAPLVLTVTPQREGATLRLQLSGLEPGARWEYSLNGQAPWHVGSGPALGVLGHGIAQVWLRQVDVAGNPSEAQAMGLQSPSLLAHEISGHPLQPSVLASGLQTYLIHGVVQRGDADHVRWEVPQGQMLVSFKLVHYAYDNFASYALQRSSVFDAGMDTMRMLAWGQLGLRDLNRNVLTNTWPQRRGEGPMTLRFQQNGPLPTPYAIELTLAPAN